METQKAIVETAEQVIPAYEALPAKKHKKGRTKKGRVRLFLNGKLVKSVSFTRSKQSAPLITSPLLASYTFECAFPLTNQSPIVDWPFPEDRVWQLKVLVGEAVVDRKIKANKGVLTGVAVIDIIKSSSFPYYISEDMRCLSVGTNELMERDFGPLKPITPLQVLQRFGLAGMEEARERGFVCI